MLLCGLTELDCRVLTLVEAIETDSKRRLAVGEYEYRLSENRKFLQRRKIGT
jgi:hypothetical protein